MSEAKPTPTLQDIPVLYGKKLKKWLKYWELYDEYIKVYGKLGGHHKKQGLVNTLSKSEG